MKTLLSLPLVNWGMGAIIITVVFALVCLGLCAIIYNMVNSGKKKNQDTTKTLTE
jgi:cell division protein FtsX